MPRTYPRIRRLLKILTLIQSGPGWGPQCLAEVCGVTVRTIHRDMDELKAAGIPWTFEPARSGYAIPRSFFLPPVQITLEEALALGVLCGEVAGEDQNPLLRPAWRALAKLRARLPDSARKELAEMDRRVAPPDAGGDAYDTIHAAIASRTCLRCRYESNNGGGAQWFLFDPHVLFFSARAWYAIGRHHGESHNGRAHCLKLNRFTTIEPTDQQFEIQTELALEDHLGNAWSTIRGTPEHDVEILFDADFANTVSEIQWHKTQEVEHHPDGSATFRCTVAGLDEILWWVLSMGPHCRVIGPIELAERVRDAAHSVCRMYESRIEVEPGSR